MKEKFFKAISSEKVLIREFLHKDYHDIYELLSNYNVCKYLIHTPFETKNEAKLYLKQIISEYNGKGAYKLAIVSLKDSKVIGYIGISTQELTRKKCQIIYALSERYWHQGYTSEALKLYIDYLLNVEKKGMVFARHVTKNKYSGMVMKKAGLLRDESLDIEMIIHGNKEKLISYSLRGGS